MLLVSVLEHVLQITFEAMSKQESSYNLLNLYDFEPPLVEVNLDVVSRPVTSIKTLYKNTRTVSFEYSP